MVCTRACIKLNDFIKDNETDKDKIKLITFARNGYDGVKKAIEEQKKPIKLTENTDFEFIYNIKEVYEENRKHYFYERDLKKYDEMLRKKQRGKRLNGKKYNTTYS